MVATRLSQGPWNSFLTPLYCLLAHCGNKRFSKICCNKKRSRGFTQEEGRFKLDIRKKCLILGRGDTLQVPREVMNAPFLETFKAKLGRALSNVIQVKLSLLTAEGLD